MNNILTGGHLLSENVYQLNPNSANKDRYVQISVNQLNESGDEES